MRKYLPGLMAFLLCLFAAAPAMALTPEEKEAACDAVRRAASGAMEDAIAVYVPKQNPSKTFTDATKVCLRIIMQYNKIPLGMIDIGILGPILRQLGEDLLMKECSAAANRFNQTLYDALGERGITLGNGQVLQYTGSVGGVNVSAGLGSDGGTISASGNNSTIGGISGSASTNGQGSVQTSNGGLVNWGSTGSTKCEGSDCK